MKNLILDGYWVNKKSGTIHFVSESVNEYTGTKTLRMREITFSKVTALIGS